MVPKHEQRVRILTEFREMPGLRLTAPQAGRLCGIDSASCGALLEALVADGHLKRTPADYYVASSAS